MNTPIIMCVLRYLESVFQSEYRCRLKSSVDHKHPSKIIQASKFLFIKINVTFETTPIFKFKN